MADNKLNISILRQSITDRTNASEKEANLFLRVFAEQIVEGLKAGEQVKINGLGTFRLQEIAARKSVDVNTGEAIVIPNYKRMVFSPEISVREMVENNSRNIAPHNPNETAQSVAIDEDTLSPMEKLGRQADEIVDILADLGQDPRVVTIAHTQEPQPSAPIKETEQEQEQEQNKADKNTTTHTSIEPELEKETKAATKVATAATPRKKRFYFWRDTLICVSCLLIILVGGFFFLRHSLSGWIDNLAEERELTALDTVATVVAPVETATPIATTDTTIEADSTSILPTYTAFITTEQINEGSRLTWLAYRYYGNKAFWVYIYDANKDHIDNPNHIKVGTPIRIPKLTKAQQDTTLTSTREVMKALEKQAMHHP